MHCCLLKITLLKLSENSISKVGIKIGVEPHGIHEGIRKMMEKLTKRDINGMVFSLFTNSVRSGRRHQFVKYSTWIFTA